MTMEHRRFPRIATRLPVGVYHRCRHLGRYEAREISVDGMFLQSGPLALNPFDIVELRIPDGPRGRALIGMVIHTGPTGLGVMFDDAGRHVVDRILADGVPSAA